MSESGLCGRRGGWIEGRIEARSMLIGIGGSVGTVPSCAADSVEGAV